MSFFHSFITTAHASINRGTLWATALLDWASRKPITINGAKKTADWEDNLSTDTSWTQTGTTVVHDFTTDDRIEITSKSTGNADRVVKDMLVATVSDEKWVYDFEANITSSTTDCFEALTQIASSTGDLATTGDYIGVTHHALSDSMFITSSVAGTETSYNTAAQRIDGVIPENSNFYYRLIRHSATKVQLIAFLDSERTEVVGLTPILTLTGNPSSLRYCHVGNYITGQTGCTYSATFDNPKFYDGVTTVENIPSQQTTAESFDFTSATGWTTTSSARCDVDAVTDERLEFDTTTTVDNQAIAYDHGSNFSDERWVMRFSSDITAYTTETSGAAAKVHIGLFSANQTSQGDDAQDGIFFSFDTQSNLDRIVANHVDGVAPNDSADEVFTEVITQNKLRYFEIIRKSETLATFNIYSDANYSILVESITRAVEAGIDALRYIKVGVTATATITGNITGWIDDLKVWDNISEVNPATLTDYPLPVRILGDVNLQRKTAETRDEDFNADGWTDQDSAEIGVTAGTGLLWDAERGSNDNSHYDLGSNLSDSNWVFDVDYTTTALSQVGGGDNTVEIYLSSATGATAHSGNADRIGFAMSVTSAVNRIEAISTDGTAMDATGSRDHILTPQNAVGLTRYIRVIRTSTTQYRVLIFADKARTILLDEHTQSIASTIQSLRYIVVGNEDSANASATNAHEGTIKYMRVWDGITNPVTQETATFADDLSTYDTPITPTRNDDFTESGATSHTSNGVEVGGWITNNFNEFAVNGTNDNMDVSFEESATNDSITYDLEQDLGSGVNAGSQCVLRGEFDWSTLTESVENIGWFGLGNQPYTTDSTTSQNFFGVEFEYTAAKHSIDLHGVNAGSLHASNLQSGSDITTQFNTTDKMYVEIIKDGTSLTAKISTGNYMDAGGSLLQSLSGTITDQTDIQYILVRNRNATARAGEMTGTLDNVKFYNGVTQVVSPVLETITTSDDFSTYDTPITLGTADFEEEYTTNTGFTEVGTDVTVDSGTADKVDYNGIADSDERAHKSLGITLDDNAWIAEWESNFSSFGGSAQSIQLALTAGTGEPTTASQDGITFMVDNAGSVFIQEKDGASAVSNNVTGITLSTSTTYYIRMTRRKGTDISVYVYSDSGRTTLVFSADVTVASTITGLTHFQHSIVNVGGSGTITGTVDNLDIWDGIGQTVSPVLETVTGDEDFTSYANQAAADAVWVPTDTTCDVDVTGDKLDFTATNVSANKTCAGDSASILGSDPTGTRWELRFKLKYTTLQTTDGCGVTSHVFGFTDQTGIAFGSQTTQDFVGFYTLADDLSLDVANGIGPESGTKATVITAMSTGVDYYCAIRRDGDDYEMKAYLDPNYINQTGSTANLTVSGITGLTQIAWQKRNDTGVCGASTDAGNITDIKFWHNEYAPVVDNNWDNSNDNFYANIVNENITFNNDMTTTDYTVYHDLGAGNVSDTTWTLRFKVTFETLTGAGSCWNHYGISSVTGDDDTTQDAIMAVSQYETIASNRKWILEEADGAALNGIGTGGASDGVALGTYYVELKRKSATETEMNVFSDPTYTNLLETITNTIPATITGLRYLKIQNRTVAGAGVMDGYIDNIQFWNGKFAPVVDNNWKFNTTDASVNITTEKLDFDIDGNNTSNIGFHYDLGEGSVSDKWVLRSKWNFTTYTDGDFAQFWFGISSSDRSSVYNANQDAVVFWGNRSTGNAISWADNESPLTNISAHTSDFVVDTDYWIELKRDGSVITYNRYLDSNYSILDATRTLTITAGDSVTNLRYITMKNDIASGVGHETGTIDDIEFWNGVSSPNASGRKIVFTDNQFDELAVEYSSETVMYDPINGDYMGYVRIPSLTTGANTKIQMYYDYTPASNPSYVPEVIPASSIKTYTDDFTTPDADDPNRGETGTLLEFDTTTDNRLEYTFSPTASVNNATLDLEEYLGEPVHPTHWRVRWKYQVLTQTASTTAEAYCSMYMSDKDHTIGGATTHDGCAIIHRINTAGDFKFFANVMDGITPLTGITQIYDGVTTTTYYCEMIRDGDTFTQNVYSDSGFSTLIGTNTETDEGIVGLKYFKVGNHNNGASWNGSGTSAVDDLEIVNGYNAPREKLVYDGRYKTVHHLNGNSLDSTIYGNDGTNTAVDWEQHNNSVGAKFSGGSANKIEILASQADFIFLHSNLSDWEFSTWISFDTLGTTEDIFATNQITGSQTGVLLRKQSDDTVRLFLQQGTTADSFTITRTDLFVAGELYHFRLKFTSLSSTSARIDLYINGVFVETVTNSAITTSSANSTNPFHFGNDSADSAGTLLDGFLDNLKISDKIRPSAEAITSYNAEKADTDLITSGSVINQ